jgi:hypothetical protein
MSRSTWALRSGERCGSRLSVALCVLGALSLMRLRRGMRVPREEQPVVTPRRAA